MAYWQLSQGSKATWTVPIANDSGAMSFAGTETLAGRVWPGGARPALLTFTPTWLDATEGTTTVEIDAGSLAPATYHVVCTVDGDVYYRGSLEVQAYPGADDVLPSYCTIEDLRDYASWIDNLQSERDQAGFARQLGRARGWLDDIIIRKYRPINFQPTIGQPGYGPLSMAMGSYSPPSKWLRDQLDDDKLIVRETTREIAAKHALYLICNAQPGKPGSDDLSYRQLGKSFRAEASNLVKSYIAEIDLDGDGYPDITVHCGASSLR